MRVKKYFLYLVTCSLLACSNIGIQSYEGEYRFRSEKGGGGLIILYHIKNDNYAYYMEFYRGAPSYNSGVTHGKVNILSDYFRIFEMVEYSNDTCLIEFNFDQDTIIVDHIKGNCGFGAYVDATGKYLKTKDKCPEYIVDMHADTLHFKDIDNWYNFEE